MADEGTRVIPFTVRLTEDDYASLTKEAKEKGKTLASYAREILQAHLLKQQFSGNLKSELLNILESEEFDDVLVSKFLRALESRKKN